MIGVPQSLQFIPQVFSLTINAYSGYSQRQRLKRFIYKILNYYIKVKKLFTSPYWSQVQFIMLEALRVDNPKLQDVVDMVSTALYSKESDIET